jgi:hypothetical protein
VNYHRCTIKSEFLKIYLECKSSYTVYYVDLKLLFALIRCFKKKIVFLRQMLNNIFDCDDVGSVTSFSEINI